VKKLALIVFPFLFTSQVFAETMYVRDWLYVTVRSGESTSHRILKNVKSGTPIEVIRQDKESGYSMVRTPKGIEGWMETQYLQEEPIAAIKFEEAQKMLNQLTSKQGSVQQRVVQLSKANKTLENENKALGKTKKRLEIELKHIKKISANAIKADQRNQELREQVQTSKTEVEVLQAENDRLSSNEFNTGLLWGAAAVIFGILFGLILPSMRSKKSSSNWA